MIKGNESLEHHFLITPKCFMFMQTPLQLDIWLQSYEEFVNAKNNIKHRNLNIRLIPLDHVTYCD